MLALIWDQLEVKPDPFLVDTPAPPRKKQAAFAHRNLGMIDHGRCQLLEMDIRLQFNHEFAMGSSNFGASNVPRKLEIRENLQSVWNNISWLQFQHPAVSGGTALMLRVGCEAKKALQGIFIESCEFTKSIFLISSILSKISDLQNQTSWSPHSTSYSFSIDFSKHRKFNSNLHLPFRNTTKHIVF